MRSAPSSLAAVLPAVRQAIHPGAEIPGGESAQEFQSRVTAEFERLVEQLMRAGDTDAVVCTHGGVVMMLMARYALPRQPIAAWAGPDGGGFTLRITPGIWMREPVAEAAGELPVPSAAS